MAAARKHVCIVLVAVQLLSCAKSAALPDRPPAPPSPTGCLPCSLLCSKHRLEKRIEDGGSVDDRRWSPRQCAADVVGRIWGEQRFRVAAVIAVYSALRHLRPRPLPLYSPTISVPPSPTHMYVCVIQSMQMTNARVYIPGGVGLFAPLFPLSVAFPYCAWPLAV